MRLLTLISGLAAVIISGSLMAIGAGNIAATKHNLSASGGQTIRATTEEQICVFCHTPHNSNPIAPLWNKSTNGNTYTPYDSSTFSVTAGTPTGSSLLCLSCHDGTLALGEIFNDTNVTMTDTNMPAGATRLSTDLSDDHPVSFDYASARAANSELETTANINADSAVNLDGSGLMQCTSCHDPHKDSAKFLVKSNVAAALCQTCHIKAYWDDTSTSHKNAAKTWNGVGTDPWLHTKYIATEAGKTDTTVTVAENACENCHSPHTAGNPERILNYANEEAVCFTCHNSNVAAKDIEAEFVKASTHPIYTYSGTGDHDAAEDDGVNDNVVDNRHVVCFDCHNPHGVQPIGTVAGKSGPLNGAKGVDIDGNDIEPVDYPHQVCFRCHGDSTGKPAQLTLRRLDAERDPTNVRLEYNPASSASYHPVSSAIDGGSSGTLALNRVPSLISGVPLALGGTTGATGTGTTISCLDCHNNDQNPNNGAGGTGPSGPHGSANVPILERNYTKLDGTVESLAAYAMCYKCHDQAIILGSDANFAVSTFNRHNFHITGAGAAAGVNLNTPC
ncbi:MAG: hypothetical protein OEM07_03985, partial [Gammaproteobacteria bacterium]|nr:hypothetical protein [Gammaproteobacteria bacterium]